jgi:hypothetical protein
MAQQRPTITFEDIPLEQAHGTTRGPRMDPELNHALREKIASHGHTATSITLPDGTRTATMKNRITRVATDLGVPVTIRCLPGGLLSWRSTNEALQQANQVVARLHSARQPQHTALRGRRG